MGKSRVVVLRGPGITSSKGQTRHDRLERMFDRGLAGLTDATSGEEFVRSQFPSQKRIGIKINTLGGPKISTLPSTSLALSRVIVGGGIQAGNIIIWDRYNRELREAGYRLNIERNGVIICGTDTKGMGYDRNLHSHLNIGSLISSIQTGQVHSSISLAILKDHGLAGVTAGMKNYFGALHNPNKYHDSGCDPFVAEVFDSEPVKTKHRITILDALTVQFHRGPSYHPQWAAVLDALVFSLDPVAADYVGWQIIENLRSKQGLPSLTEEGREPRYLKTAETMGLGKANAGDIEIVELEG